MTVVDSNYCLLEFELAFRHCITVLRKKRLVVLMTLDSPSTAIDDVVDESSTGSGSSLGGSESIRHYLRHYTYIDYTAADWFDRLVYALPLNGMLRRTVAECMDNDSAVLIPCDE